MHKNRKIIYLAGFLFSIPIALSAYINSSFLSSFIDEKLVGIVYALGSIVSILALILAPKIIGKINGYKFLLLVTSLDALTFFLLNLVRNWQSAIVIFILGIALNTLVYFSLDELLKICSRDSSTGKIRGIYITVCNFAWITAQLSSGTILGNFSFKEIYLISFLVMTLFLIVSSFFLRNIPDPQYDKTGTLKYIKEFIKNGKLFNAYVINLLLQIFFCWMVIYTPIYLSLHLGFSWNEIGIMFAIMLLPFSFIPFSLGRYADKIGERKMLMLGFTIATLATLSLFFIHGHQVWLWATLLFATRMGAATIEVMIDSYFFKHIKPENEEYIGVYRSASPVAYIIGPLSAFFIFTFVPSFNFIYLVLSTFMLLGIYLSSKIEKSDI